MNGQPQEIFYGWRTLLVIFKGLFGSLSVCLTASGKVIVDPEYLTNLYIDLDYLTVLYVKLWIIVDTGNSVNHTAHVYAN